MFYGCSRASNLGARIAINPVMSARVSWLVCWFAWFVDASNVDLRLLCSCNGRCFLLQGFRRLAVGCVVRFALSCGIFLAVAPQVELGGVVLVRFLERCFP